LIPNHAHLLLRTGTTAIATVMRRLLTGYAVSFNCRHRRHCPLFSHFFENHVEFINYIKKNVKYFLPEYFFASAAVTVIFGKEVASFSVR
jgi:hypothetical protein